MNLKRKVIIGIIGIFGTIGVGGVFSGCDNTTSVSTPPSKPPIENVVKTTPQISQPEQVNKDIVEPSSTNNNKVSTENKTTDAINAKDSIESKHDVNKEENKTTTLIATPVIEKKSEPVHKAEPIHKPEPVHKIEPKHEVVINHNTTPVHKTEIHHSKQVNVGIDDVFTGIIKDIGKGERAHLHVGPSRHSATIERLAPGTHVKYLGTHKKWNKVELKDGTIGYVFYRYV